MKKCLIFLLFISFSLSLDPRIIEKEINNKNNQTSCKGGRLINKVCKCPNGKKLIKGECKAVVIKCKGGILESGKCKCPDGRLLYEGECLNSSICPPRSIKEGNTCKKCGRFEISKENKCEMCFGRNKHLVGNKCIQCPMFSGFDGKHCISTGLRKPVIYLYPEEPMDISVQLNIKNSKFTTIYPKFNGKNTWNIHAKPNGDILIKDKTYPYLFWEAESYNEQEQNEGFLVTNENAEEFLEEKLKILGLNEKEKTDFITYWLPLLLRNKLSLCTFQTKKFFENYELNIFPKPDSLIRVFLTIKKLDTPVNIKEQKLESVERKGFTVIEWGGSDI